MGNRAQIDTNLNKSTTLSIIASSDDIDLSKGLWAVNWFNTKRKWLYNIYTALASPLVVKVGGKLVFKGEFIEKIAGEDHDGRRILLIVNYPSAQHFIDLIQRKFFQFVSILRILAVDRFIFGFTKRINIEGLPKNRQAKGAPCLVHHFRGGTDFEAQLKAITTKAIELGIHLAYAGTKAATLKRSHSTEGGYEIPFTMDGILVFEAANQEKLDTLYKDDVYQVFLNGLENSYVGVFRKLA